MLHRYGGQLGTLIGQRRAEAALTAARVEAERLAEAAEAARVAAESSNRAKSQFLANMSHELRTPLNAIIGFSEVMATGPAGPLASRYPEYARDILSSGRHLLALINDILDLAKIEAGKLQLSESIVDLDDLVRASLSLVDTASRRIEAPASHVRLWADPRRLKQTIVNLVSNAAKFTDAGGRIAITASLAEDGSCGIVVTDDGIGIAPEHMAKVLEPFGQVEDALSRNHQGIGLGLPLTRALIELHGGRLAIASAPGRGTAVTLHLPAERVRLEAPAMAAGDKPLLARG